MRWATRTCSRRCAGSRRQPAARRASAPERCSWPSRPARRPARHHPLVALRAARARYPAVEVEPDPIFVRDGDVITSAGVTAGMDLALALVEEDHGREVALATARMLVVYARAPAASRSSRSSSRIRRPSASRCGSSRHGSPSTPTRTSRSARWRPGCTSPSGSSPRLQARARGDARRLRRAGPGRARPLAARDGAPMISRASRPGPGSPAPRSCAAPSTAASAPARASTANAFAPRSPPDPTRKELPCPSSRSRSRSIPAFTALDAIGPYEVLAAGARCRGRLLRRRGRARSGPSRRWRRSSPTARSPRSSGPT